MVLADSVRTGVWNLVCGDVCMKVTEHVQFRRRCRTTDRLFYFLALVTVGGTLMVLGMVLGKVLIEP